MHTSFAVEMKWITAIVAVCAIFVNTIYYTTTSSFIDLLKLNLIP